MKNRILLVLLLLALFYEPIQAQRRLFGWVECYQGYQEREAEKQRMLDEMAAAGIDIDVKAPSDPNEIRGTDGYNNPNSVDTLRWVSAEQSLPYTIYFENDPNFATAAAQRVEIRHQIHPLGNLATFGIGTFGFGEHVFAVEGSPANYQQRLDLTASMGIYVDVVAGVDVVSNEVFWIFQSIDPETGLAPQGAEQGFLPVNDEDHSGEGFVTFTIKPKTPACSTGDDITASASIVFDVNEAIGTNVWTNTIDAVPPTTQVTGEELAPNELLLQFSGQDDEEGCGIKQYKLYVSDNYAAYQLYDTYTASSEATFTTEYNHCYRFISLGEDNVGNVEEMKEEHDYEYGNYNLVVSAVASPEEGGTITGAGTYVYDSEVTLTAIPNTEYVFRRWTLNGVPVSEEEIYTFDIHEDMSLVAEFVPASLVELQYDLAEGWNWWSTCIDLTNDGLEQVEDALENIGINIKSQRDFVMNDEGDWYGNLIALDNQSMYMLETSSASTINLTGLRVNASQLKIELATNWTWISYPLNSTQSVTNALSQLDADDGDMIKSMQNFSIYDGEDGWFGALRNLSPGQGYMYYGQQPHDLYYTEGRGCIDEESAETTNWKSNIHAYANNMSLVAVVSLDDELLRSESYEVAAFSDGICLGSTRLLYNDRRDSYYALLPVSGEENMEVTFKLYRSDSGYEYPRPADETYGFVINGIYGSLDKPVTLHFHGNTGVQEMASELRLFPNPVKKGGEVRLELPDNDGPVHVEIYNALDVMVDTQIMDGATLRLSKTLASGIYVIRAQGTSDRVYYGKLIVQ